MSNINLATALKEKNRLVARINVVKNRIQAFNNRYPFKKDEVVDCNALWEELNELKAKLIELKTNISRANIEIYGKLASIEELKDTITMLQGLNTAAQERNVQNPKHRSIVNDGEPAYFVVESVVQIDAKTVTERVSFLQSEIERLQDEIDTFNGSTRINYVK